MKKYLAFVLAVAAFIFISPFSVSAAAEEEWKNKLDLSDTISSSVVELDDGVVMIQYEGGASEDSTLTKYDFKGNQVWSIKNEYGYEIASLGDSLLVFTTWSDDSTMTKISSDGEVVWTKQYGNHGYTDLIDLDSGFVLYDSNNIYRYDENGNLLKTCSINDIRSSIFDNTSGSCYNFIVSLSNDKKNLLVYITCYQNISDGSSGYYHAVAKYSLNLDYESSSVAYSGAHSYNALSKMVETDNNYIATGNYTLVFNKNGQIDRVLNVAMIDIAYIDGYVYAYVSKATDNFDIYNTYIVKYDENMEKIMEYQLPYNFSSDLSTSSGGTFLNTTSFAYLKDRSVFYKDTDGVHLVILNSPMFATDTGAWADIENFDYNLSQYRLTDAPSNDPVTDDGIINNILQNPETSSIAVVITFVVLVLIGGLGFYLGYKKKVKSE